MFDMKKRSFILIEILLAFVLVTICSIPLIRQPLKLYRLEIETLEQIERERLADWTFSEIKEKLFKNEISWEKIPQKNEKTAPFRLPSVSLHIPGCPKKTVERQFTLQGKGEKVGPQGEIYRTLKIEILFTPSLLTKKTSSYPYRLIVKRLPKNPPEAPQAE